MQRHTKIYFDKSGIDPHGFVPCEICQAQAVDVNHIDARGMGGDPTGSKDTFGNLQAACRDCHNEYGDISDLKPMLKKIHAKQFPTKLKYIEEMDQMIEL